MASISCAPLLALAKVSKSELAGSSRKAARLRDSRSMVSSVTKAMSTTTAREGRVPARSTPLRSNTSPRGAGVFTTRTWLNSARAWYSSAPVTCTAHSRKPSRASMAARITPTVTTRQVPLTAPTAVHHVASSAWKPRRSGRPAPRSTMPETGAASTGRGD